MMTMSVLRRELGECVKSVFIADTDKAAIDKYYIADGNIALDSGVLYICTPESAAGLLARRPVGLTLSLAVAESHGETPAFSEGDAINCLASELDMTSLCNKIFEVFTRYARWLELLQKHCEAEHSLQEIIDIGNEFIHAPFILNGPYGALLAYSSQATQIERMAQIVAAGFISPEKKEPLSDRDIGDDFWSGGTEQRSGLYRLTRKIKYANVVVANIVTVLQPEDNKHAVRELIETLAAFIEAHLSNRNEQTYRADMLYTSLVSDLIECRVFDKDQLAFRLRHFPTVFTYACVAIVASASDNSVMRYSHAISLLREIFCESQIVQYKEYVLLIIKCPSADAMPKYDRAALYKILESFELQMAFSYPIHTLIGLASIFSQLKSTLSMARFFDEGADKRIYYFSDYYLYHIIDICGRAEEYAARPSRLLYLSAPGYYLLGKHDRENGSNLTQLLRVYYDNDCSVSRTAEQLFFHRNTVTKKLDLIRDIVSEDINSAEFRQKMVLAFAIEDYVSKYKGITLEFH